MNTGIGAATLVSPPMNIIEHLVDVTEQGSISTVAVAATGSGSKQQLSETPPPVVVVVAGVAGLEMQVVVEAEDTTEVVVETAGAGVGEELAAGCSWKLSVAPTR